MALQHSAPPPLGSISKNKIKGTSMITLEANYSKKIGLPGYSSHQFSVTLRTEIADLSKVQDESSRLYKELQHAVDTSIQQVGYLPETVGSLISNGSKANGQSEPWKCSDKQKSLILKIVEENKLDKNQVEALAQERFGTSVRALNKLQASGLIEELIEKYPSKENGNGSRRYHRAGAR
jgi:hypothetical protein